MSRARTPPVVRPSGLVGQCAFCGYDLPDVPVVAPASSLAFCSRDCRSAFEAGERPFVGRHATKRFRSGVSVLDALLPWGIPRNSVVLLSGDAGIRHRELQTELVWRTLSRGEPAVIVSLVDPPIAIVEAFLELGWNVLPYLESEQLRIVDCVTTRLREDHQSPTRLTEWNEFLRPRVQPVLSRVEDPTDMRAIENRLFEAMEAVDLTGTGLVTIDSLNELEVQGQQLRTRQLLQELRTEVCKWQFVPIVASVTTSAEEPFSMERSYLFDGIVDMRRSEELGGTARIKQLSVRKMDGVGYLPHWVAYDDFGDGFVAFDPDQSASLYPAPDEQQPGGGR